MIATGPTVYQVGDRAHLDHVAGALKDIHQASCVDCGLHRVLLRRRKRRVPLVNGQRDVAAGNQFPDHLLHLAIEALHSAMDRARRLLASPFISAGP